MAQAQLNLSILEAELWENENLMHFLRSMEKYIACLEEAESYSWDILSASNLELFSDPFNEYAAKLHHFNQLRLKNIEFIQLQGQDIQAHIAFVQERIKALKERIRPRVDSVLGYSMSSD